MKKTLQEFAWQIYPELCTLLLVLYKESPRRFMAFVVSFLQWLNCGAKRDSIEAHTPKILKPFEQAAFQNECAAHLARFRNHHDGATTTKATPRNDTAEPNATNTRPTREEIDELCRTNNRDPVEYGRRIWDEFTYTNWKDRAGHPITNYTAYITKSLFPIIDKTLQGQVNAAPNGLDMYRCIGENRRTERDPADVIDLEG